MNAGTQQHPLSFQILADELVKPSGREGQATQPAPASPFFSCVDQTCVGYGSVGAQVLFKHSMVAPLLKQALAEALAEQPWFAGRAVLRADGRMYDVACTNAGARLLLASTSATLAQAAEALTPGQRGSDAPCRFNPIRPYTLPHDVNVIVKQQLPLASVYLLHLRGGGSLLAVAVWHGLTDFQGLQTLVAHLSAAYNNNITTSTITSSNSSNADSASIGADGPASADELHASPVAAAGAALEDAAAAAAAGPATPAAVTSGTAAAALRRHGRWGFFDAAAVDSLGRYEMPAGMPPREVYVALTPWQRRLFPWHAAYQVALRGGGVEERILRIPAHRLAELKRTATRQLNKGAGAASSEQRQEGEEGEEGMSQAEDGGGGGRDETVTTGGTATTGTSDVGGVSANDGANDGTSGGCSAAGLGGMALPFGVQQNSGGDGGPRVEWVSTRDCLAARLAQLLHTSPLRRRRPMSFFVLADLRPRLTPPLPPSQLGNHVWGARVDGVRPSEMALGELAARVRTALTREMPAQYRRYVGQLTRLLAEGDGEGRPEGAAVRAAARHVTSELNFQSDPFRCFLAPEGPVIFNDWRVQYDIWQFGPEPPLAFTPAYSPACTPNLILIFPPPPPPPPPPLEKAGPDGGGGGGLYLYGTLHRIVWRDLDRATGGGDLAAAL